MILIGLTGFKRTGKDSSANVLVAEFGFQKVAFADALRTIALRVNPLISCEAAPEDILIELGGPVALRYADLIERLGYERAKEIPDFRNFLQRLGTDGIRDCFGKDAWVEALERRLFQERPERVVVPDCRFLNEAKFIRRTGMLWRVIRPGFGGDDPHPSETEIPTLPVDREITATTLSELQEQVRATWLEMSPPSL